MKPEVWETLVAHNHWFTVRVGSKGIRLCARCTGIFFGFTFTTAMITRVDLALIFSLPLLAQIAVCLILAAPIFVDWSYQYLVRRESTNDMRLLTGVGTGTGVSLLLAIQIPFAYKMLVMLLAVGLAFAIRLKRDKGFKKSIN